MSNSHNCTLRTLTDITGQNTSISNKMVRLNSGYHFGYINFHCWKVAFNTFCSHIFGPLVFKVVEVWKDISLSFSIFIFSSRDSTPICAWSHPAFFSNSQYSAVIWRGWIIILKGTPISLGYLVKNSLYHFFEEVRTLFLMSM